MMTQEGQSVLRSEYEALHLAVPWEMCCLALPEPPFPGVGAAVGGATLAPAHSPQHCGDPQMMNSTTSPQEDRRLAFLESACFAPFLLMWLLLEIFHLS